MKKRLALGITCSLIVSAAAGFSGCSSSSNAPAAGTGGGSAKDSGSSTGGASAGGSTSAGGSSAGGASAGGSGAGGASAGGASAGGSGAGGAAGGTGAGCLQESTLLTPAIKVGCEEFLSSAEYAQAQKTCTGIGATGIAYSWVTSCPAGKIGGCKVPPGATGGAPGGTIRWQYTGTVTCAAGETKVNADGTAAPVPDAGMVAAWNGKVGPGGPVSQICRAALSGFATGTRWLACAGMCPSCNNGAGAPNDAVCLACIDKDYAAASCSTDTAFNALFQFACNDKTYSTSTLCATECGH